MELGQTDDSASVEELGDLWSRAKVAALLKCHHSDWKDVAVVVSSLFLEEELEGFSGPLAECWVAASHFVVGGGCTQNYTSSAQTSHNWQLYVLLWQYLLLSAQRDDAASRMECAG